MAKEEKVEIIVKDDEKIKTCPFCGHECREYLITVSSSLSPHEEENDIKAKVKQCIYCGAWWP